MTNTTIFLLFLSVIIAAGLSFYQYIYKNNNKSKVNLLLTCLRFISIFGLLLLLINPIISRKTFEIVKTPLPIIIDNSSSIVDLKASEKTLEVFQKLSNNADLKEKFDIQTYKFDSDFQFISKPEEINFKGTQTNIEVISKKLKSIYRNANYPAVLISDGNQTIGNDYIYSFDNNINLYPIVVGDTTTFMDLKIAEINVNKYAFQKNKFPVEIFLEYTGDKKINTDFKIEQGNSVLFKQAITFSPSNKSQILNILLPADKIGLQIFKASISSKETEKNTYNNTKNFAIEVIDQKTNIAIVSSLNHPDIGVLKRAIQSNSQRKVEILKPLTIKSLYDYNVLILYQPNAEFKTIFENNKLAGINTFIITGTNTDFAFLNLMQSTLSFNMSNQKEDYLANFNADFNLFAIDNIGFETFPPLANSFGTINIKENISVLLDSKIRNVNTNIPLLAFSENQGKRIAFLLGENIWKWRLQYHVDHKSYDKFDVFIDKIIQFLASNNTKKSLVVNHENFYNSGESIEITAQYFNKNYEFDYKARLTIVVTNKETKKEKKYDFLKTNNAYKVNLDGLSAGKYDFSVRELNSNSVYKGSFEVLDFDIEKQFVNPDLNKLTQVANQTQGKVIFPDKTDELVKTLLANDNYKAIQKAIVTKTALIDWIWLLILIVLALTCEWFIRKYNGMM